jgi:hypothetical protein
LSPCGDSQAYLLVYQQVPGILTTASRQFWGSLLHHLPESELPLLLLVVV